MGRCKISYQEKNEEVVPMRDMKPLEIGVIQGRDTGLEGRVVMRTASTSKFEVFDLSKFKPDCCWTIKFGDLYTKGPSIPVRLFRPEEEVTLKIRND